MVRGVIISRDAGLREELEKFLAVSGGVVLLRAFDAYPPWEEYLNFCRAHRPQVVFLDLTSLHEALEAARTLSQSLHGAVPVALHWSCDQQLLLRLMHAGVREFLSPQFDPELFRQSLERVREAASAEAPAAARDGDLFVFLPAKAGDGASTIAVNACLAASRNQDTLTLLADFDLNACMPRFLLKLSNPFTTRNALDRVTELDDGLWRELVSTRGSLHVLAAGDIAVHRTAEPARLSRLIDFCRPRYPLICADMSPGLEEFALEVLTQARRICLVMTPDLPSAFHAREKLRFLDAAGLEDRVDIVLNRWHKHSPLKIAAIEEVLGIAVEQTLPDDPGAVHKAMMAGAAVDPASELGREFAALARRMRQPGTAPPPPARQRAIEHFAVVPARYTLIGSS